MSQASAGLWGVSTRSIVLFLRPWRSTWAASWQWAMMALCTDDCVHSTARPVINLPLRNVPFDIMLRKIVGLTQPAQANAAIFSDPNRIPTRLSNFTNGDEVDVQFN